MKNDKSYDHVVTQKNDDGTTTMWKWRGESPIRNDTMRCTVIGTKSK